MKFQFSRSDPIAILFVSNISVLGGAERTLVDILKYLDKNKYLLHLATNKTGELSSVVSSLGIPILHLPFLRLKRSVSPLYLASVVKNVLCVSLQLAEYIRKNSISIVHANNDASMLYAGIATMLTRTPCIWHCRDFSRIGCLHKLMCRWASKIVAVSQSVADYLRNSVPQLKGPNNKLVVIMNGIDTKQIVTQKLTCNLRNEFGIQENEIIICTVGQLVPWKNHQLFLKAAELIVREIPSAKFIIVGDDMFKEHPDYVNQLQMTAIKLGLEKKVIFTGYKHDALSIIAESDVLIHTATMEPFGRTLVEAMTLGKPIVAVNSCGPSEIIRSGIDSLLVEPDNPRALADSVLQIVRDKKLSFCFGDSARKRATQLFDARRMVAELESVYTELTTS